MGGKVNLTTEMTTTMFAVMELANSIASWPTTTPNPHAAALANVRSLYTRLRQAADSAQPGGQPNVDLTEAEVGIIGGCCDIALMTLQVTGSPVIPGTTVSRSQIADLRRSMMTVLQSRNVTIGAN